MILNRVACWTVVLYCWDTFGIGSSWQCLLEGGRPILLGHFWYRVELALLAGGGGPILLGHFWYRVELGGTASSTVEALKPRKEGATLQSK